MEKYTVKIKTFAELTADKNTTLEGSEDLEFFVVEHRFSHSTFTDEFEDSLPEDRIIEISACEGKKHLYQWYSGDSVFYVDDWMIDDNYYHGEE